MPAAPVITKYADLYDVQDLGDDEILVPEGGVLVAKHLSELAAFETFAGLSDVTAVGGTGLWTKTGGGFVWTDPATFETPAGAQAKADAAKAAAMAGLAINAEDHGVSTSATASFNAGALAEAAAAAIAAGRPLLLPAVGVYNVDTTSAPAISVGAGEALQLLGLGQGNFSGYGTMLRRTAGSNPIAQWAGTGTGSAARAYGGLRDITLDGNGDAHDILVLSRAQEFLGLNFRVSNCTGYGIHASEIWNCRFGVPFIYACGNGRTKAAFLIDGISGEDHSQTVLVVAPQFEGNSGIELQVSGDPGHNLPSSLVQLLGGKIERGGAAGPSGATTYPAILLDFVDRFCWANLDLDLVATAAGNTATPIEMTDRSSFGGLLSVAFPGLTILHGGQPAQMVLVEPGYELSISDFTSHEGSVPTTAYITIASGVASGVLHFDNFHVQDPTVIFNDQRTVQAKAGTRAAVCSESWTDSSVTVALAGPSSNIDVKSFPDGATSWMTAKATAPRDYAKNAHGTLRVFWASPASSGAVKWQVDAYSLINGDSLATDAHSGPTVTQTVPGTANTITFSDFAVALGLSPFDAIAFKLSRLGADAADTCTDVAQVLRVEFICPVVP